jgi:hypothetical protein
MKIDFKISLFIMAFYFGSVFYLFAGFVNIAKASPICSECITYCQQYGKSKDACRNDDCIRECTIVVPGGGPVIYTKEMCLTYYGFGYVPTKDGTSCKKGSKNDSNDNINIVPGGGVVIPVVTPVVVDPGETVVPSDASCDSDQNCSKYNCCSDLSESATQEQIDQNNQNKTEAELASIAQEEALIAYEKALQELANCGNDTAKCQAARDAIESAKKAFAEATARVVAAVTAYNVSNLVVFPNLGKEGTGYLLCANGLLAKTCKDGSKGEAFLGGITTPKTAISASDEGFLRKMFQWPMIVITLLVPIIGILVKIQYFPKKQERPKRR